MRLFTIGYERGGQDAFIAALRAAGVTTVLDVRQLPSSRRAGFSKTPLSNALAAAGIGYLHLRALGTPKAGRVAHKQKHWDEFWSIVDAQLATPEAAAAFDAAAQIVAREPCALMCLEADATICHRSRVAARLRAMVPVEVEHLHVEVDWP